MKTIAPTLLGQVHRLIGVTQQGFGIFVVVREQRDANAGKHIDVLAMERVRRRNCPQHPVQRGPQLRQIMHVAQHQDELVATQPRDHVLATHDVAQALGHLHQ
ncbi:hypothetical protein D3C84_1038140 [compost metagenome]